MLSLKRKSDLYIITYFIGSSEKKLVGLGRILGPDQICFKYFGILVFDGDEVVGSEMRGDDITTNLCSCTPLDSSDIIYRNYVEYWKKYRLAYEIYAKYWKKWGISL